MSEPKESLLEEGICESSSGENGSTARDHNNRGVLLHMDGDYAGARMAYQAALEIDPDNATALNNLGFLLAQEGKLEKAIRYYQRALEIDPHRSMALTNLGSARAALSDLEGGLKALEQATKLDPNNVLAWDNLARLLMATGNLAKAEVAWRSALAVAPTEAHLHTALGTVFAAQRRLAEAAEMLQRAVQLDPNSARAWAQLGVVLFMRQDMVSAKDGLRRAVSLAPDDLSARHHLSMVLTALGEQEAAVRELERILALDPDHVPAQTDLAIQHLSREQFEAALCRLDAVLQTEPDNSRALFYRALVLKQLGQQVEATEILGALAKGPPGKYEEKARRYLEAQSREKSDVDVDYEVGAADARPTLPASAAPVHVEMPVIEQEPAPEGAETTAATCRTNKMPVQIVVPRPEQVGRAQNSVAGYGSQVALVEALRREVARGFLHAHSRSSQNTVKTVEAASFCYALIELLQEKGLLTFEELDERQKATGERLIEKFVEEGVGAVVVQDFGQDKYTCDVEVKVDCASRIHLCRAACCRLDFALSRQDVEEGIIKWDLGSPYSIAKGPLGYCQHLDRATYCCTVRQYRPIPCRGYDCRNDERIWLDFEQGILNPNLEGLLNQRDQLTTERADVAKARIP